MTRTCKKCRQPFTAAGHGRPSEYCSQACRRLAEFEIRRLTKKLDALEYEKIELNQSHVQSSAIVDVWLRTPAQQLQDVEASILRVEERLRQLFDEENESGKE